MQDSSERFLIVPRERIAYITKIFEAMGHLAVVSTVDRQTGRLRILHDPSAEADVLKTLEAIVTPTKRDHVKA